MISKLIGKTRWQREPSVEERKHQLPPMFNNHSFKQRDQVCKEEFIFSYNGSVLRNPELNNFWKKKKKKKYGGRRAF